MLDEIKRIPCLGLLTLKVRSFPKVKNVLLTLPPATDDWKRR
jgi:hypothetical protein